ncbi:MAG: hypothetical protein ACJAQT_001104 [Akkermansiaceae bacterium]
MISLPYHQINLSRLNPSKPHRKNHLLVLAPSLLSEMDKDNIQIHGSLLLSLSIGIALTRRKRG